MRQSKPTIGVREAARRLSVTTKYIYDLVYCAKLPAEKVARQWRIPAEAVEDRLKKRVSDAR
jgi:excisionase family DNA binding protein